MKTYYNPDTAPATNGTCDLHNEALVLIGRMTLDGPLEYVCPFCMNDLDKECLHAHEGGCTGEVSVVSGTSGLLMAMCNAHELKMYQRQDAIRSNYR